MALAPSSSSRSQSQSVFVDALGAHFAAIACTLQCASRDALDAHALLASDARRLAQMASDPEAVLRYLRSCERFQRGVHDFYATLVDDAIARRLVEYHARHVGIILMRYLGVSAEFVEHAERCIPTLPSPLVPVTMDTATVESDKQ
jgi:hypothetical protein